MSETSRRTSDAERQRILADPGFGQYFTDHMVLAEYDGGQWGPLRTEPYRPFSLDPASLVFHYGQAIFEGLKAYRHADDSIVAFRPDANAARMRSSAARLAMAELPEDMFLESLRMLIAADSPWVPPAGGESSLYLRPFQFATEVGLGMRPAGQYQYALIACPSGAFFPRGVSPVSVWLSTEYVRACPGGTGAAKFAGNYAASFVAQKQAVELGCDQVVWLDAAERRYVEEMGGMNLFFVFGSGDDVTVATPELSGALLPGVTRNSLLAMLSDRGIAVEERRISVDEWRETAESGALREVFACGTAAVITPVGLVRSEDGDFYINGGEAGPVTMSLREQLTGIQRGSVEDPHGWIHPLS